MQEILSTNKICSLILASKSPSLGKENIQTNNTNGKQTISQKLLTDHISSSQLRNIQKQLQTEKSFSEILSPYRQLIAFNIPELFLNRFNTKNIKYDNTTIQYDFLVLMNSYIHVCMDFERLDFDKSISILHSLNNFRLNFLGNSNKKQCHIITSAFYHLYMCCLAQFNSNNISMERLVPIVTEFFIQPSLLFIESPQGSHIYKIQNEQVFEMLSETIKVIVKPNERLFNPLTAQFVSLIDSLVLQIGKNFPIQYLKSILQMSSGAISGLDSTALVFLSHISNIIDSDSISSYLTLLPFSILSYIENYNNDNKPIIEIKYPRNTPVQCMNKTSYFYPENSFIKSVFVDSIDLSNYIAFPDLIPIDNILPKEILIKISLIGKVAVSNINLTNSFIQNIPKVFQAFNHSTHALDAYASLLVLIKEIEENVKFQISIPIDLILNQVCFNPLITVFSFIKNSKTDNLEYQSSWKIINTLRSITVDLIVKQGVNQMQTVLYNTMLYPEMFAEIIHRFLNVQGLLKVEKKDISLLSQTIMSPMIYYQHFANNEGEESEEEKEEIESIRQARLSIIFFLNNLLSQPELASQFFEDQFFVESLLSHLYEKPVRPSVIAHLTNYLTQKEAIQNTLVINQIVIIAKNSIKELNILDSISLLNNLLSVINKAILMNSSFMPLFKPIIPDLCKGVVNLQKHEDSDNLLYNIIQFLTLTATNNSITNPHLNALEKAIMNIFEDGPNPTLFGKIVQLIAGQSLSSLHPSFTIRNPKALRLLVAVFKSSPILLDAFSFIAKLFQHSIKNCEEAHRGEFDIYLMNFLDQYRNDDTFPITTFASALSLFMLISTNISSVSVVHSFISLLSPIDGRIIPHFQKLLVKSLSSMIPTLHKRPLSSLPLSSKTKFTFKGLKGEMFQGGFTFSFWIFINSENPNYVQQIISIEDIAGKRYAINITSANIQILFEDTEKQYWAKNDEKVPLHKWCFVSVTAEESALNDQLLVMVQINGQSERNLYFPRIFLQQGILRGSIGGISAKSADIENPSLLGSVGVFKPLDNDDLSRLYELGPCVESMTSVKPLAFFVPHEHSGILSLKENSIHDFVDAESKVTILTDSVRYFHYIPFCDVLISKCGINTILPLFAQLGMKFSNGENFTNLASISIEILQNMLSLSEKAQHNFYECDGFLILNHLLMKADDSILSYSIYNQFFNLFNEISDIHLKKQIFDVILMNVGLWMKCDAENHRRILRHWSKSLVPTFNEITIQVRSFSWMLSALRAYYWYNPIETNIAINEKRCRNQASFNVKDCRNSIMNIAEFISSVKFDDDDFVDLISHILTCTDHEQIVDLLSLLSKLIRDHKEILLNLSHSTKLVPLLQYLLNISNVPVISSALQTICDAHYYQIFNEFPIDIHIDIILHNIVPQMANKAMLKNLIELAEKIPESFPICSWVAMNIGDEGIRAMLKKLKPNVNFTKSEFWSFYAVVGLYKGDQKLRRYLSRFLIKCSMNGTMESLIASIEVIGRALEENSDAIKHTLLLEYGKLIKRESLKTTDNYFALVKHYLFFRLDNYNSPALQELYENSPFVDSSLDILDSFESSPLSPIASPTKPKRSRNNMQPRSPQSKLPKPLNSPSPSPKKSGNRRANNRDRRRSSRHSLHPNAILCSETEEDYNSPLLAQRALACLNPISQISQTNESFKARRTSLFTVGRKPVENDSVNNSPDNKMAKIELMPADLDDKIKSVAQQEFKYSFGIRMNRKQEWLDFDLAEQAFDLYLENKIDKYDEIAALIASFLGIWKPEIISQIDYNHNKIYSLLDHFLIHRNNKRILSCPLFETEQIAFSIFQSFETSGSSLYKAAPLRLLKHFIKYQRSNSEKAYDIFSMISTELVSLSTNHIADFTDSIGNQKNNYARLWNRFWSCVTIERAPWHKSLPPSYIKQQYFKRDDSFCFSFCPMKMKQNKNFCDHMDASFLREGGNYKTAKDLYEKYKEELKKQYEEKAPVELLEIVEEENHTNDEINFDFESIGSSSSSNNNNIKQNIVQQQRCIVELPCEIIHVNRKRKATFSLLSDMIIITKEKNKKTFIILLKEISMILFRTHLNHPTAIEFFLSNGFSYLINFFEVKSIPIIRSFSYLNQSRIHFTQNTDNFGLFFKNLPYTQDWINRKISNFEYLMKLNVFSGRTFNDPSQYPIMPWIIKDYESKVLDLANPETFRDLSKPVGALNEGRLFDLKAKMGSLSEIGIKPYLYSSGAINPLSTYLFMLRVEPFTTLHIDLQSGRFDHAARLFNSIPIAFKLAMRNPNDYREIIPEFFYLTEFLENKNHFDIGTFNGKDINSVELPNWASNPFEFVYLHRKALESDYVSDNLNKWIDLIWGEKQRGQKAVNADNTYMPYMYDDIWDDENNLQDLAQRAQIESVLTHVGQIPHQLFQKPHPQRNPVQLNNMLSNLLESPTKYELNFKIIISSIFINQLSSKIKIYSIDNYGNSSTTVCSIESIKKSLIKLKTKGNKGRSNLAFSNRSMSEHMLNLTPNKRVERACSDGVTSPIFQCIPFDEVMSSSVVTSSKKKISKFIQIFNSTIQKYIYSFNNELSTLFVVGSNNNNTEIHQIHFTDEFSNEETLLMSQPDNVVCIATDKEWLATANTDAVVTLYKIEEVKKQIKHKLTFPSYTSSISCISISSEFHSLVFGTRDGCLLFCSLTNGTITKIINLKDKRRPVSLLITPSWGFVVVFETEISDGFLKYFVEVFSINGEIIREKQIESEIVSWSSFRNEKGFDFLICANAKNECYICEAFYLNNLDKPFFISPSKVAALSFLSGESVASITTHKGEFIVVPVDL